MRVLLLNPPGSRRYLRDYYCSTVSKSGYYWQPMDLLAQSGHLHGVARLGVLDAVAQGLSPRTTLERLEAHRPEVVLALVGGQSTDEDVAFLRRARARLGFQLALTGEVVLGPQAEGLRRELPGTFLLHRFTSDALARWISAGTPSLTDPDQTQRWELDETGPIPQSILHLPAPRHDLFDSRGYRVPFDGGRPVASVLTAYGCPHRCAYCGSGASSLGYAERPLDDVFAELGALDRPGRPLHLFLRDMDLTAHRKRTLQLCAHLTHHHPGITFSCYARPDELDDELCVALAAAGCRLVQLGLESLDESSLEGLGRPMGEGRIREGFRAARRHGIRCGAHVILGLPGEGWATWSRTLQRVLELDPEYLSLNLLQHRPGATLSSAPSALPAGQAPGLTPELFRRWATYRFYLRPGYLLGQLRRVESAADARALLRDGLGVLFGG